jgi:NAD(P) transhydrogenase subunit alpha
MNQELAIANKQAAELSEKAAVLSEKLTSLATEVQFQHTSTVDPFIFAITIFSALHTPLMSITNAISGIIIIGALIASSSQGFSLSMVLGFLAAFLASINIFGGFIVTERMLEMFKKK